MVYGFVLKEQGCVQAHLIVFLDRKFYRLFALCSKHFGVCKLYVRAYPVKLDEMLQILSKNELCNFANIEDKRI